MHVEVFIDGASRNQGTNKPRRAACAVVVYNMRKEVARLGRLLGDRDHNEAEYEALISCLTMLSLSEYVNPIIYSDSALVVNQVNGNWKVKAERLIPYYITVSELQAEYSFKLVQVRRKRVFVPDEICNKILDFQEEYEKKQYE